MEKSPSKPSVAELAGRLEGHILPMPTSNDALPFRRRPPCSLNVQHPKQDHNETDKSVVSPNPQKLRTRNSPLIEKLQANLALSPSALLPSPKSPEVKLQPAPLPPARPRTPPCPTLQPSQLSTEDEDPVSFDSPPEGAPLQSINKTRARLSFKRRPPTRQHRRSAVGEEDDPGSSPSPCDLHSPKENGDEEHGMESPAEEEQHGRLGGVNEAEDEDTDCGKTEEEAARSEGGHEGDPEKEETSEGAQDEEQAGGQEEEEPAEQTEEVQEEENQRASEEA